MKITPVLLVDNIESSLPFWTERIGFEKIIEVPEGERLGFVILAKEGAEVMLQTMESVRKDEPKFADATASRVTSLFIEVKDFEDVLRRLRGYPIAMEERTTFYGMREIGVFDPGGHIVMFAKRV
ncbi:MAG TPA: VOC family protein [Bryobacteraceae bacterium]|nr:VOC family protein [Bryobacteraceae bacterium]